jgi:hypothetical protein
VAVLVTATASGAKGFTLRVLVLTGAVEAGGNSDGPTSNTGGTVSFTPTFSNSFVAWSNNNEGSNGAFTAIASNTILDNIAGTTGTRMATGYYSSATTAGVAITVGATGASTPTTTSVYEIPPSGASVPVIDASSPPVVDTTSAGGPLYTSFFQPPLGSVIVAILAASDFPVALAVGSNVGMVWTSRINNTNGQVIYTATYLGQQYAWRSAAPGRTNHRRFHHRQYVPATSTVFVPPVLAGITESPRVIMQAVNRASTF